jgi:outer membrane protein OmpA-like peptidoglycan-associated protein
MIRKASVLLLATIFTFACATTDPDDPNAKAKKGAGAGAAAGAIVGAILGNQVGGGRAGAVVGAVVGAAVGASIGHNMDKQAQELKQIPGVEVTRPAENEIAINLTNDILFDFNSAALRAESRDTLRELANNFAKYPNEAITVEGHTDAIGTPERNQLLSEARANNVRDYLVDNGVPGSRVTATGFGDTQPKASNETPEGRQLNRRVEIHVRELPR